MSKKLSSTILLFLIGAGFAIYGISSLIHADSTEAVVFACLYLMTGVVAFGALIMLPFKQQE
jgi:hypothetical protein